jgi:phage tail sheath protein FI
MPITPTYPGVYIEEIPSGVRTITGVATSITAFIGRAKRGPVDKATVITSYADYERIFGGLDLNSAMSFAVRDFYRNGGSTAVIVRLYEPTFADEDARQKAFNEAKTQAQTAADTVSNAAASAVAGAAGPQDVADAANVAVVAAGSKGASAMFAAKAVAKAATDAVSKRGSKQQDIADAAADAVAGAVTAAANASAPVTTALLTVNGLKLEAISQGAWGNNLQATISHNDTATKEIATKFDVAVTDLFNVTVKDLKTGTREDYLNVTVVDSPRRIDKVLENSSRLVKVPSKFTLPTTRPADNDYKVQASDYASDGTVLTIKNYVDTGKEAAKEGLYALEQTDLFNLLCLPPDWNTSENHGYPAGLLTPVASYCEGKRRAMLLLDPPDNWSDMATAETGISDGIGTNSVNAAIFFPRVKQPNPLRDNQLETFVPCGVVAGVFARTDAQRGVWKAPAGLDATLNGVTELTVKLTDDENGRLNPLGVNCLRSFPVIGRTIWGSRTLKGADILASEWKYIPVRRTALFIEESLYRGTQWVVFEPNDEPLWAQIRLNVGAFMHNLFRKGAFQGTSPRDAYYVKCDKESTTQNDIDLGIVNIEVGFAPLKPAEFVIIKIRQIAGELEL